MKIDNTFAVEARISLRALIDTSQEILAGLDEGKVDPLAHGTIEKFADESAYALIALVAFDSKAALSKE